MSPEEAAQHIAELIREGYLSQSGRDVPGVGEMFLQDEFIVSAPAFAERAEVIAALRAEMGWP